MLVIFDGNISFRSIDGFQVLVQKEWLDFGHKMADRCGTAMCSPDTNERSPIFLQWLDCVHQLLHQYPTHFEFNHSYLVKLAAHTYSSLFGTFFCNTMQERVQLRLHETTRDVWTFLRNHPNKFRNLLYQSVDEVVWPKTEIRDLLIWKDVYMSEQKTSSSASAATFKAATSNSTPSAPGGASSGSSVSHANGPAVKRQNGGSRMGNGSPYYKNPPCLDRGDKNRKGPASMSAPASVDQVDSGANSSRDGSELENNCKGCCSSAGMGSVKKDRLRHQDLNLISAELEKLRMVSKRLNAKSIKISLEPWRLGFF